MFLYVSICLERLSSRTISFAWHVLTNSTRHLPKSADHRAITDEIPNLTKLWIEKSSTRYIDGLTHPSY